MEIHWDGADTVQERERKRAQANEVLHAEARRAQGLGPKGHTNTRILVWGYSMWYTTYGIWYIIGISRSGS